MVVNGQNDLFVKQIMRVAVFFCEHLPESLLITSTTDPSFLNENGGQKSPFRAPTVFCWHKFCRASALVLHKALLVLSQVCG